jgi:hypothetical protein
VGINLNNDTEKYFPTKKGLGQTDPMSPIMFNIIVDMLPIITKRPKDDGQITGGGGSSTRSMKGCPSYNMR